MTYAWFIRVLKKNCIFGRVHCLTDLWFHDKLPLNKLNTLIAEGFILFHHCILYIFNKIIHILLTRIPLHRLWAISTFKVSLPLPPRLCAMMGVGQTQHFPVKNWGPSFSILLGEICAVSENQAIYEYERGSNNRKLKFIFIYRKKNVDFFFLGNVFGCRRHHISSSSFLVCCKSLQNIKA